MIERSAISLVLEFSGGIGPNVFYIISVIIILVKAS